MQNSWQDLSFWNAWVAISKYEIIRLFSFENADEEAVTVTKGRYIDVLYNFWRALGTHCCVNPDVQWFQQEGVIPHTANIPMELLDHQFPNWLISRQHKPKWSPHSPLSLGVLEGHVWNQWPSIRRVRLCRKRVRQDDWQLHSTNSSAASMQCQAFGTYSVKNASFQLETSNQCFFFFIVIISASRTCYLFSSFLSQ